MIPSNNIDHDLCNCVWNQRMPGRPQWGKKLWHLCVWVALCITTVSEKGDKYVSEGWGKAKERINKGPMMNFPEQKIYGIEHWICSGIFKFYNTPLTTTQNSYYWNSMQEKCCLVFECLKLSFFVLKTFLLNFSYMKFLRNTAIGLNEWMSLRFASLTSVLWPRSVSLKHSVTYSPTQVKVPLEIIIPRRPFYLEESSSSGVLSKVG